MRTYTWASDSATEVTIEVAPLSGAHVEVSALVAEPGPIVAMKLQAIMNRAAAKQGTDLQDIVRLILDEQVRPAALAQRGGCDTPTAADGTCTSRPRRATCAGAWRRVWT